MTTPSEASYSDTFADVEPMMLNTEKFDFEVNEQEIKASAAAAGVDTRSADLMDYHEVNDTETYLTFGYGKDDWMDFTKRGEGVACEIWVADDCTFASSLDYRNSMVTITDDQIDYMIDEFDNHILPIESDYFGVADSLNGSNSVLYWDYDLPMFNTTNGSKVMIMVFNIVDTSFYVPTYPSYIVGYYSSAVEEYYDRNIIHIDCFDWANRIGADSARPYVYESTIAHEYQHLLHDDLDSDEDTFINEGCSMYAEMLCNYGSPWGHINDYLATPDNSLVEWGDQGDINILADYGAAALFTIYLNDHFGGADFISALAANEANGVDGVNAALADAGFGSWDFDRVFYHWRLANLIHTNDIGGGWFNYTSIDFSNESAGFIDPLEYSVSNGWVDQRIFGPTYSANGDMTEGTDPWALGAYGTDYIYFENDIGRILGLYKLGFDGVSEADDTWEVEQIDYGPLQGNVWWSGNGDLKDRALRGSLDLTGLMEANLSFQTSMAIEDGWDFGFVQVSTDGGETWTSVNNSLTTEDYDPNAHPNIIANLPGLTGYYEGEMWFNLTAFIGQEVLYQFRYMTDWGTTEEGWYIDNVTLNGVVVDNGDDIISLERVYRYVDFMVTIYAPEYEVTPGYTLPALLMDVPLDDLTDEGSALVKLLRLYGVAIIIISGDDGPSNYEFGLIRR